MSPEKPSYTITEAAKIAGLSRPILYKAIQDGRLRAWRTWSKGTLRIRKEDLEAWMLPESSHVAA